ncbi:unnamed protein product [Zymoseptoria tritici ST99CH_1A5]|uniref:BTB domain-containing protein n=3 Tax=Zymoseptoria tritici TaxID=1047171 RepID=A0A2H1H8W2_ZYMTR|nr:unnamed protein product [Zymoseptoria tritici ST99CH_1E4]SMY30107.1 unnamed protein product [Zymoseptoria tritici ST99CH_1A5]
MLGPNFLEGQEQDDHDSKQVMLPDDKPVAMEMMCNIIQHRNGNLPPRPTAMEIYDLAIAADKYDCVMATSLAARAWMQLDSVSNAHDLGLFMLAAYIYAFPEIFFQVTARLVLSYNGSYQTLDNIPGFMEHFGWEVMLCLEEKRSLHAPMVVTGQLNR